MERRIVFATGNQNKMKEIRMILEDLGMPIYSMKELGIEEDIVEDGETFEANAEIKARAIAKHLPNDIILADDSGLEIDFLDKAPGVYSARFAGEDTSYDIKNNLLLDKLKGVPDEKRTARFVCVICAVFPDGAVESARGTIEGRIAHEIMGENGFGYDPIFRPEGFQESFAEMPLHEKNGISHRGQALRTMKEKLAKENL